MSGGAPFFTAEVNRRREGTHRCLHVWAGPLGLHLFAGIRGTRLDWCGDWRKGPLCEPQADATEGVEATQPREGMVS